MKIKGLNHIGINTMDIKKSLEFYGEILGLEHQYTLTHTDDETIYFLLPNGERIELFDYYGKNNPQVEIDETRTGYRHIAIEVDNVKEWEEYLIQKNTPIVLRPTDLPDLGVRVLLFKDPNGVMLEFLENIR